MILGGHVAIKMFQTSVLIKERLGVIIDVLNEVEHVGDAEVSVHANGLVHAASSELSVHCQPDCFLPNFLNSLRCHDSEALQPQTIDMSESNNWHDPVNYCQASVWDFFIMD